MHRLIAAVLIVSAVGVVAGEAIRGYPGPGVLVGCVVLAGTLDWWRQRNVGESVRDVADRLALYMMTLAIALACAGPIQAVEAWLTSQ